MSPSMKRDLLVSLIDESIKNGMTNINVAPTINFSCQFTGIESNSGAPLDLNYLSSKYLSVIMLLKKKPALAGLSRGDGLVDSSDFMSICSPGLFFIARWLNNSSSDALKKLGKKLISLSPVYLGFISSLNVKGLASLILWSLFRKKEHLRTVLECLRTMLIDIDFNKINGKWTSYYTNIDFSKLLKGQEPATDSIDNDRFNSISKILAETSPASVIDIGANQGLFSILAASHKHETLAVDYDIACIDLLYNNVKSTKTNFKILPLVVNFTKISKEDEDKYRQHTALALGFTHHLYYVEKMSWEQISIKLSSLCDKQLITEFKPNSKGRKTKTLQNNPDSNDEDYSLEKFVENLGRYFSNVNVIGGYKAIGSAAERILIHCTRA